MWLESNSLNYVVFCKKSRLQKLLDRFICTYKSTKLKYFKWDVAKLTNRTAAYNAACTTDKD
jgi:hypothetical protein